MGNPAGHFCSSAGDEFADAAAPRCRGALEDAASAADLAARLGVSPQGLAAATRTSLDL